jgi:hypothetical protein
MAAASGHAGRKMACVINRRHEDDVVCWLLTATLSFHGTKAISNIVEFSMNIAVSGRRKPCHMGSDFSNVIFT